MALVIDKILFFQNGNCATTNSLFFYSFLFFPQTLPHTMQALWRRGTSLFSTPSGSPKDSGSVEDFRTASSPDKLFTKVDPAVDGEECLHDCASCTVRYPAKFDVDQEDTLYGNVNGWSTHLLVATGKTDWVRDVADEQGSVMEAIEKGGLEPGNGVSLD